MSMQVATRNSSLLKTMVGRQYAEPFGLVNDAVMLPRAGPA
jgi:hypothetical protein